MVAGRRIFRVVFPILKGRQQNSKCSIYVYHWMRLIRFLVKILAASDTESDYAIRCTWVLSLHLYR